MSKAIQQTPKKTKRASIYRNEEVCGIIMASIPIIRFLLFSLVPMVIALIMAFYNMKSIVSFAGAQFVKFENFANLFKDINFSKSIINTLIYAISLPISIVFALIIASVMNARIKGRGIFRVILFLPYICSTVAIVYMWKWLYDYNYGILNTLLGKQVPWLNEESMFRLSIIIMMVWATTGYKIILLSAALTAVNPAYYEAAEIDGAGVLSKFRHITLPAISPTIFYLVVMGLISIFQLFSEVQVMDPTGGSKVNNAGLTMVFYLYRQAFNYTNMGMASAAAWVLSGIILIITMINFKISKLWVSYD